MPPEKPQWAELFSEVVTSGLCTGCASCVVACPYDVLGYDDGRRALPAVPRRRRGRSRELHARRTRLHAVHPGLPAFSHLGARDRLVPLRSGARRRRGLRDRRRDRCSPARRTRRSLAAGQDGGFVSTLVVWALEHDVIDAALVSYLEGDGRSWQAVPGVARDRADVFAAAGSRYTYSANPLAYAEAVGGGAERVALVGMSCQASAPPAMAARRAGKVARRFALTVGLICSKTFDDAIFAELFEARYGLRAREIVKIEHQRRLPDLDPGRRLPRDPPQGGARLDAGGLQALPRLRGRARRHLRPAGSGPINDWTLTIVRTERGAEIVGAMRAAGAIEVRPAADDPTVVPLLAKLSRVSRRRWPEGADAAPRLLPVAAG